jgi:hypothetical protein
VEPTGPYRFRQTPADLLLGDLPALLTQMGADGLFQRITGKVRTDDKVFVLNSFHLSFPSFLKQENYNPLFSHQFLNGISKRNFV